MSEHRVLLADGYYGMWWSFCLDCGWRSRPTFHKPSAEGAGEAHRLFAGPVEKVSPCREISK